MAYDLFTICVYTLNHIERNHIKVFLYYYTDRIVNFKNYDFAFVEYVIYCYYVYNL